jgi:hypothetical protein
MKTTFVSETFARLSAESPKFFKKLQALGISLAVLGAGLLAIPGVPAQITHLTGYLITAGSVLKLIASLPVCNPDDIKPASNTETAR